MRTFALVLAAVVAATSLASLADPSARAFAAEKKEADKKDKDKKDDKDKRAGPAAVTKPPALVRQGTPATKPARAAPAKAKQDRDGTSTTGKGTLDPIGIVRRGQTVEIKGTVFHSGQTCTLKVAFADGTAKRIRDVSPDAHKRCSFTFTIPDELGVVGRGKAEFAIKKASGGRQGFALQRFTVQ